MPLQYRAEWSGPGGQGFTVLNFRTEGGATTGQAADDVPPLVREFFLDLAGQLPTDISVSFPGEVLELDTATGQLLGVHSVTSPASVTGSSGSPYAAPAGGRVDWITPAIVAGRRLTGRTYVVPLQNGGYEANGTLSTTTLAALNAAATNLIDGFALSQAIFGVWSRTHGIIADVTGHNVPDKVAILTGRRD